MKQRTTFINHLITQTMLTRLMRLVAEFQETINAKETHKVYFIIILPNSTLVPLLHFHGWT